MAHTGSQTPPPCCNRRQRWCHNRNAPISPQNPPQEIQIRPPPNPFDSGGFAGVGILKYRYLYASYKKNRTFAERI